MATIHDHAAEHGRHPGVRQYITIAVILGIITLIEVGIFFLEITSWLMAMILLTLSLSKFALVVGYFMHLKFDDKRFMALFVIPMIAMVSIAVVLLAVFGNLTR
ncbi:MAG: cytochrome C oxidase subunit IV [SAR202 cluster bacterium]|nr:cytochrome C oxidase subunit IV [SAR202 cluster bacterium]